MLNRITSKTARKMLLGLALIFVPAAAQAQQPTTDHTLETVKDNFFARAFIMFGKGTPLYTTSRSITYECSRPDQLIKRIVEMVDTQKLQGPLPDEIFIRLLRDLGPTINNYQLGILSFNPNDEDYAFKLKDKILETMDEMSEKIAEHARNGRTSPYGYGNAPNNQSPKIHRKGECVIS